MCKIRAKHIVVSNTSLFGAEAVGLWRFGLRGWPQWPQSVKGRGLNGPLIQPKSGGGGWRRGGLSFDTLCWAWAWASFPIQASLESVGLSEGALTWLAQQGPKFLAPGEV